MMRLTLITLGLLAWILFPILLAVVVYVCDRYQVRIVREDDKR